MVCCLWYLAKLKCHWGVFLSHTSGTLQFFSRKPRLHKVWFHGPGHVQKTWLQSNLIDSTFSHTEMDMQHFIILTAAILKKIRSQEAPFHRVHVEIYMTALKFNRLLSSYTHNFTILAPTVLKIIDVLHTHSHTKFQFFKSVMSLYLD